MAMSDLELLELVEKAQQRQKGERGEPGVGISAIEQFDETGFTLRLTDGSFKRISLPAPEKGEVGATGPAGERGEPGPAGRAGRDGKAGRDGAVGRAGADGSTVDTALVNSKGHLLIGLSDGQVIDCGRVVGPAGETGDRGLTGLPGEPGVDGAAVLSGPRTPTQADGKEGDHWIDISSAEFNFYKKSGTGWTMLASLRSPGKNPAVAVPVGGGGSGGGGELQNTRTLPLINGGETIRKTAKNKGMPVPGVLLTQEDANQYFLSCLREQDVAVSDSVPRPPHQTGQLWFCTNPEDLTLYIYDGAVWVPAAPPVSLDGIEASITGIQDYIDTHITPVLAGVSGDVRTIEAEGNAFRDQVAEDQQHQNEQIAELEAEIDDLRPTIERGEWLYNSEPESESNPKPGEYHAYVLVSDDYCKQQLGECLLNAAGDTAAASQCNRENEDCLSKIGEADTNVSWHEVEWLSLARSDQEGRGHEFGDVVPGMYIEAANLDGSGHGLYIIEGKSPSPTRCGFMVKPVHSTGHPNGKAVIKIFNMAEAANPEDYVRKDGDTMTGKLSMEGDLESRTAPLLYIKPTSISNPSQYVFQIYSQASSANNFLVQDNGELWSRDGWVPTHDRHLTPKKFVDEAIQAAVAKAVVAPARFEYKCYTNQTGAQGVPNEGQALIYGTTIKARTIQLSLTANNGPVPFQSANGLTMYYYKSDTKQAAMTISCWYYRSNGPDWKWKGTAEIERVRLYSEYIEITTVLDDSRKWNNGEIGNADFYRFTISGLF